MANAPNYDTFSPRTREVKVSGTVQVTEYVSGDHVVSEAEYVAAVQSPDPQAALEAVAVEHKPKAKSKE